MFNILIEIALKTALENPEIKEKLRISSSKNKQNKIINLDKNDYTVLENDNQS